MCEEPRADDDGAWLFRFQERSISGMTPSVCSAHWNVILNLIQDLSNDGGADDVIFRNSLLKDERLTAPTRTGYGFDAA